MRTLLSDHHFSDTPSTDAPLLCNCVLFQSNHASALQQCVGCQQCWTRQGQFAPEIPATIQPDILLRHNLQRVVVRVLLSVLWRWWGSVSAG